MAEILVVGQAPGRGAPSPPLAGRAGERLARLHGLPQSAFLETRDVVNLLDRWPGARGPGDAFPMAEARSRADAIELSAWRLVVLLGRGVAAAFRLDAPFLEWREHRGSLCAILPHPSGRSRWWNDRANHEAARRFCRAVERRRLALSMAGAP